jgi:hypothetical protein
VRVGRRAELAVAALEARLAVVSGKSTIAAAIRYALSRWDGLARFLDDGRIEIDPNVVERAIRPIALGRKNHLFAEPRRRSHANPRSPRLRNPDQLRRDER